MGKTQKSERGKMAIGLSQVIRSRKSDLDHPQRWNYTTLVGARDASETKPTFVIKEKEE